MFATAVPLTAAQTPAPAPTSTVVMSAEPMLGPSFRFGSWVAVRVILENNGPTVDGVLRLSSGVSGSTFGLPLQLPSGARQQHILYSQPTPLSTKIDVVLESAGAVVASQRLGIESDSAQHTRVYVMAERPEALVGPIRAAADVLQTDPEIVAIGVDDLPSRMEPWSSIDILVWQDVDSNQLSAEQIQALRTWVGLGGTVIVLGGSTGATRLGAFPADLLPFAPAASIDVPPADLEPLLGTLPTNATNIPAFAGALDRGVSLASSGVSTIAARTPFGAGSVTLSGVDPTTPWIATSPTASAALWSRLTTLKRSAGAEEMAATTDESFIVNALSGIPSVTLPRLDQLFLLLAAYIITIGPLNYIVLRRRDRREWAWLTMPITILGFAVIAYAFGTGLRGSNVVVNELAIVRGAAGSDQGIARAYVGIYSPTRTGFDVRVGGSSLVSSSRSVGERGFDQFGRQPDTEPLDVYQGDPATIRNFGIGFGSIRSFRAEASVATPLIATDLTLVDDALSGSVTNTSDQTLAEVALVYGNGVQLIGQLAPGETRGVELQTSQSQGSYISERLVPSSSASDPESIRRQAARRSIIQHLAGGWNEGFGQPLSDAFGSGPQVLVWGAGPIVDVDLDATSETIGETLYVMAARASIEGPTTFSSGLLRGTTLDTDGTEAYEEGSSYVINRGTVTTEYRPVAMDGTFVASELLFRLGTESVAPTGLTGQVLAPLPDEQQPPSDDPLLGNPRPGEDFSTAPIVQLFDITAEEWVEFEPVSKSFTYSVPDLVRYVDSTGAFRVRFVSRSPDEYVQFTFNPRLTGTVE